jgi:hypothetical protein
LCGLSPTATVEPNEFKVDYETPAPSAITANAASPQHLLPHVSSFQQMLAVVRLPQQMLPPRPRH